MNNLLYLSETETGNSSFGGVAIYVSALSCGDFILNIIRFLYSFTFEMNIKLLKKITLQVIFLSRSNQLSHTHNNRSNIKKN